MSPTAKAARTSTISSPGGGLLPPQTFSGLPHVKCASVPKGDTPPWGVPGARVLPVARRTLFLTTAGDDPNILMVLPAGGPIASAPFIQGDSLNAAVTEGGEAEAKTACADVYYLGEHPAQGVGYWAMDVTTCEGEFRAWAEQHEGKPCEAVDMRAAMVRLGDEDCALAGRAAGLSQWHQNHKFCNKCGGPTLPIQAGAKRSCGACKNRLYPRTDPVAIMLVESPDGSRALLGRSKKIRTGMYTALSGFIDQCEGIEEAMAREIKEESGVDVSAVDVVGSQPWPIGRGGSCELMIGGIAKAISEDIKICPDEMDDVQWFTREELCAAVAASAKPNEAGPFLGGGAVTKSGLEFFIPPPIAIAHHLIKAWCDRGAPWFPASKL